MKKKSLFQGSFKKNSWLEEKDKHAFMESDYIGESEGQAIYVHIDEHEIL